MYTGDALIADNAFRNELFGGITVMTRPSATRSSATTCGTPARGAGVWYPDVRRVQHARRQRTRLLDQLARVAVRAQRGREQRAGRTSDHGRPVEPDRRERLRRQRGPRDRRGGRAPVWADGDRGNYWEGQTSGSTSPASERTARPPRSTLPSTARSPRSPCASRPRSPSSTDSGDRSGARSGSIIDPAPAAEPYSPDRIDAALDPDAGPVRADWRAELGDGSGERRGRSNERTRSERDERGIGPRPQRSDRTTVPTVEGATASIRGVSDA